MWARFHRGDIPVVLHYLGLLLIILAMLMAVPLATALIFREWQAACRYLLSASITLLVGLALRLAVVGPVNLEKRQAVAITVLIWAFFALFGSIPLALSGHYMSPLDAVFDSISSLTDTGLSLINDIDHMANADDMWRFAMQFIGGQGVILVALSLGIFTKSGASLYSAEGRSEAIVPNLKNTARFIWQVSGVMVLVGTVVLTVICMTLGFDPLNAIFNALWVTIGAYDTGGLSPHSLSISYYHSWPLEVVVMLLMLFGSLNFILYAQIGKGSWKQVIKDIEVKTMAVWIAGMLVLFVLAMLAGNFLTDVSGLVRRGIFTIVSASTSTGYTVFSQNQMSALMSTGAVFICAIAMAIGGSSGSTTGGIKALRIGLVAKTLVLHIKSFLLPSSALVSTDYYHITRRKLRSDVATSALIVTMLYVASFIIGALVGISYGYGALPSTFESISATANNGLSLGVTAIGMPVGLEITYMLQMWLGRLEFISVLAVLISAVVTLKPRRKAKPRGGLKPATPNQTSSFTPASAPNQTRSFEPVKRMSRAHKADSPLARGWFCRGLAEPGVVADGSKRPSHKPALILLALAVLLTFIMGSAGGALAGASTGGAPKLAYAQEADGIVRPAADMMPQATTIGALDDDTGKQGQTMDERMVKFDGECIGDILNADAGHKWVVVADGNDTIPVYMANSYAAQIQTLGNYGITGTHVRVIGTFELSSKQQDGLCDVNVQGLQILDQGGPAPVPVKPAYLYLAGIFFLLSAGVALLYHVLRERQM